MIVLLFIIYLGVSGQVRIAWMAESFLLGGSSVVRCSLLVRVAEKKNLAARGCAVSASQILNLAVNDDHIKMLVVSEVASESLTYLQRGHADKAPHASG